MSQLNSHVQEVIKENSQLQIQLGLQQRNN